jgi:hypothetical protein
MRPLQNGHITRTRRRGSNLRYVLRFAISNSRTPLTVKHLDLTLASVTVYVLIKIVTRKSVPFEQPGNSVIV